MCGQNRAGVRQDPVAQFGECDAATRPFDDGTAHHGLDAAHVLADGRLRQVEHRRRAVKSATVGHRHDTAQRRDVQHLSHAANILRSAMTIKNLSDAP